MPCCFYIVYNDIAPSEVPSASAGMFRRVDGNTTTQLAFGRRVVARPRARPLVAAHGPAQHLRAAALFPVQHAQERLDRLITFRGRQGTQFPEERRVARHLGGPQRAAHDPRPQRALSSGRKLCEVAAEFISRRAFAAPRLPQETKFAPARGADLGPGPARGRRRRRRLKRAVPLFDERVRRVRGHVPRRLAPGGQRLEPLAADASRALLRGGGDLLHGRARRGRRPALAPRRPAPRVEWLRRPAAASSGAAGPVVARGTAPAATAAPVQT